MLQAARLPGVVSFEDFDRYCEEHDVQPGHTAWPSRSGWRTSPAIRSRESLPMAKGPMFTAEPEDVAG